MELIHLQMRSRVEFKALWNASMVPARDVLYTHVRSTLQSKIAFPRCLD